MSEERENTVSPKVGSSLPPGRFAGDLWARVTLEEHHARYARFVKYARPAMARFVESIVLHPHTVVPTDDFMSAVALINFLGERTVISLLECRRLSFARLVGGVCYAGGGRGFTHFHTGKRDQPGYLDEAADTALSHMFARFSCSKDPKLGKLILGSLKQYSAEALAELVGPFAWIDAMQTDELRAIFFEGDKRRDTRLRDLPGLEANQFRLYGDTPSFPIVDEIGLFLAVAIAHLERMMADLSDAPDISTATPLLYLLYSTKQAEGRDAGQSFVELCEIADVPDIGEAVLQGVLTLDKLIKLADSVNGKEFQRWFHANCRRDTVTTAREYVSLLKQVAPLQQVHIKVIRFVVTSILGKVPVIGDIAGALDTFFVEKWLRGVSPKYFISDVSQLTKPTLLGKTPSNR